VFREIDLGVDEYRPAQTKGNRHEFPAQRRALTYPLRDPLPHRGGVDQIPIGRLVYRQTAVVRTEIVVLGSKELRVQARKLAHQNTFRITLASLSSLLRTEHSARLGCALCENHSSRCGGNVLCDGATVVLPRSLIPHT
jgi:hypothetical protein